jgi:pilus assembly protein CpaE
VSGSSAEVRLLLVEDVPQVAHHIRSLLTSQQQIRLLGVLTDGVDVAGQVRELRPDVVVVDALLQGKVGGLDVVARLRREAIDVPVVVLTVPQRPLKPDPSRGIAGVLTMPVNGFDLMRLLPPLAAEYQRRQPRASSRIYSVFAPKGGVGKTTLAFNLAVALSRSEGLHTVLVDGSLQFGDLRTLLKVPVDAPSILDLPTDRISESDLADVVWRDASGIDILLAPPRVEMAEMVTVRDVEKVLSLLRRAYQAIVIDTPASLHEVVLAFLDGSDTILEIVTYDSTTIRNVRAVADTFRTIGYPPDKIRYVVNRADSQGGIDATTVAAMLGVEPEFTVVSDGRLVVDANNQGHPFVLAAPEARITQDVIRMAGALVAPRSAAMATAGRRG